MIFWCFHLESGVHVSTTKKGDNICTDAHMEFYIIPERFNHTTDLQSTFCIVQINSKSIEWIFIFTLENVHLRSKVGSVDNRFRNDVKLHVCIGAHSVTLFPVNTSYCQWTHHNIKVNYTAWLLGLDLEMPDIVFLLLFSQKNTTYI